ncbi:hypothetical protein [Aeromonas phage AS-yj]|uniref:DUF4326 domain-containing protein n=4 Tax=Ceceduovirus TaxID=2842588 RepID=A0A291LDV7_9CAUD|nr:hypothetical protein HWB28_gp143 [Aeromonas phage AS-zj]YP_009835078.1 hypothetical protein HWB29_gp376 [Aeromonas phage AS-sw]ATI17588.1 hypothetical protein [Aeromonas phage AS-szw]ATI17920.1 hypothetical protein [Aeromonas phage AS-yj]UKM62654.1 hypothetical protein P19_0166 [Aeromonas phage P19]ASU00409.1 hypothetical protein [Aeromonas phage AS-zj]ATI18426.1 hypothetical protein [Aeromonas phage AS-sw]
MNRCRSVNLNKEPCDVVVMRPSKWGNPFPLRREEDREIILEKYKNWLTEQIRTGNLTREDFKELEGKRLGCCCKPKLCHADILAYVVNKLFEPSLDKLFGI